MQATTGGGEADARYLERVADDVRAVLGPGEIVGMEFARGPRDVAIRCRHAFGGVEMVTEGRGGTPLEAHADLRARLVEDRISLGLRALLAST